MEDEQSRRIGKELVVLASPEQRDVLRAWAEKLLEIRASNDSALLKAKAAILATTNRSTLTPLLKVGLSELKRVGWSERGLPARMAIGAATFALTLSGQGAGIAALGGAIGVPLFVVFGAGGALAGVILDEIHKSSRK